MYEPKEAQEPVHSVEIQSLHPLNLFIDSQVNTHLTWLAFQGSQVKVKKGSIVKSRGQLVNKLVNPLGQASPNTDK